MRKANEAARPGDRMNLIEAYKALRARVGRNPILDVRMGDATLRSHLAKLSARVLNPTLPNPMLVDGHWIAYPARMKEAYTMAAGTLYSDKTLMLHRFLRQGDVYIDIGAHIGYFVLIAARIVGPSGRVYAFEPSPENQSLLTQNIERNAYASRVTVVPKAVTDKSGRCALHVSPHSSLWHTTSSRWGPGTLDVETISLDAFLSSLGWPPITLIKLSIHGNEKAALVGMAETIRRNSELKLIMSLDAGDVLVSGMSVDGFVQMLHDLGFTQISLVARDGTLTRLSAASDLRQSRNLLCERAA